MAAVKQPAIVVAMVTHSYGVGLHYEAATRDIDPRLVSPLGSEQANSFVWDHALGSWEKFLLDKNVGTNANTHPKWNAGQIDKIGMTQMYIASCRQRWPDQDIYLLPLSRFAVTMVKGDLNNAGNDFTVIFVDNVTNPAETLLAITPSTGTQGNVEARVHGLTGLTPDINSTYPSVLNDLGGSVIVIPTGTTGVAGIAGARVNLPPGNFDPIIVDESSLYKDFATSVDLAYEALWAADLAPDPRALFVHLGVNDAAFGLGADFEAAMNRFVADVRLLMTVRGAPRDEMAIIWQLPFITNLTSAPIQALLAPIRAALIQQALVDSRFIAVNLDGETNPLDPPVALQGDNLHPTYRGYMDLARAMTKGLDAIPDWDAPIDLS